MKLLADEELGPLNKAQKKALARDGGSRPPVRSLIDNLLDVTGIETGRMRFMHPGGDFSTLRGAPSRPGSPTASPRKRSSSSRSCRAASAPRAGRREPLLQRAMIQLFENAAKFTPAGGTVGVRVTVLQSGHYELCVADTGPGVKADRQSRIFEPFYQVDGSATRAYGGVGVGLSDRAAHRPGLGGDVRVASPSNEIIEGETLTGAAFYLTVARRAPFQDDGSSPAGSARPRRLPPIPSSSI